MATMPVPNRYDSSPWRSAVRRIGWDVSALSDTWNVMPIVNAK